MANERQRVITWVWDADKLELAAGITDPAKRTESWKLRDFYPHVVFQVKKDAAEVTDANAADDLEVGLMVNGLKQRLSDKAAVGKDSSTPGERLDAMVQLGKDLLAARTYALGGGGGGLSSEAQWQRHYTAMLSTMVDGGIPEEQAKSLAQKAASKVYPKAPQAVMLADLEEFNRDETPEERCIELSKKYPDLPEFSYEAEEEVVETPPPPKPEPPKPAPVAKNNKGKGKGAAKA